MREEDPAVAAQYLGKRVQVRIRSRACWSKNAAESLDLKKGRVTEVRLGGSCLVRFDEPVQPWWPAQSPVLCWHFDLGELLLLPEDE